MVARWWPGGTNNKPRWLIIVVDVDRRMTSLHGSSSSLVCGVGVDRRERTDNEPRWLVVVIVGVDR